MNWELGIMNWEGRERAGVVDAYVCEVGKKRALDSWSRAAHFQHFQTEENFAFSRECCTNRAKIRRFD